MDSATLPVDVKCPGDSCEYRPNVSDATLAATLLTFLAQSQHVAMPAPSHATGATAKVEQIRRPTVDEGISLEDWLYFEQRWQEYKDATRVAGLDLIYQLLDCCNPDGLRKNLVRVHMDTLASCNEYELLANIKKLAVRTDIGVRDGGGRGGSCPPIRAVCRHEFGQRGDIIRAKHNTCLNNTNLGSVTAVKGNNPATPQNMDPGKFLLLPPPPTLNLDPGKFLLLPPPPLNPFGQNSVCPPNGCWPVRLCALITLW